MTMKKYLLVIVLILNGTILPAQTPQQADSLHQLGRTLLNAGNLTEGREYTRQAMEMRKKLFGRVNEDYITSLNNYALTFSMEKNYAKAVELQEQVMKLCKKLKSPHKNLGMYAYNMGRFYYLSGNKEKSIIFWEQALPLVEKHGEEYELLLNGLGTVYIDLEDEKNMERILHLTEEHNLQELSKPCDEPACMLERAEYYKAIGDNVKAKECYFKVLEMPMDNKMKISVYESYALYLFDTKDFASAAEYMRLVADGEEEMGKTEAYAAKMFKAAVYSFLGQQYQQAIVCYQKTVAFYEQYDTSASRANIAKCNKGMGDTYSALKEYDKAVICYRETVEYHEKTDKNNSEYPKSILRLAKAEKHNKEYESSVKHHKEAMKLFDERGMVEEYADAAVSLKLCYAYTGKSGEMDMKEEDTRNARNLKLDGIINDTKRNLELTLTYFGKREYARSLAVIAGSYALKEEYDEAINYYSQYMPAIRDAIRDAFRLQSEVERMIMWNDEMSNIRQLRELLVSLPAGNDALMGELSAIAYDELLLSKGILLNSAIEFENLISAKGDEKLKSLYKCSKTNNEEIERLRKHAATNADWENVVKLTQENQELQLMLYKECQELADFTDYISYDWKNVQQSMTKQDIAIEFAAIDMGAWDDESYIVALVLTKEMKTPMAIPVCTFTEAKKMLQDEQLFENKNNLIWGVLTPYLTGKKRVFFSADGYFNRIGIEYLAYNGVPFSECYEVYRLSSTKELCYQRETIRWENVVLFGDINYNYSTSPSEETQRSLSGLRGAIAAEGFAYLPETRREINEIQLALKEQKVENVVKIDAAEASSTVFAGISGSQVKALHIATHGKYTEVKGGNDSESMKNSVLAFAGANMNDHGLVSAADIAKMDLRNCDLVVLSACETGLGKLGNDGVFGLQRGFKNAGVHTLLMSLKNVYDSSTADLMIEFYRNMMTGQTKREAFVNAQKTLRQKGYNDSRHWASFILLDAY